jgi:UDP-glucose 4-epimerase
VVTGANGFIGRRLVTHALYQGWSVTALSRDVNWLRSIDHANLTVAKWNSSDRSDDIRALLRGADSVCHLAAFIPTDLEDVASVEACFRINTLDAASILEASALSRAKHFVFYSSGNAYRRADDSVKETDPLYPAHRATFYLASKVAGETIATHYGETRNLSVAVLRVASVYGPGMAPSGYLSTCIARLRAGQEFTVLDGGRYRSDLVYVDDVVQATLLAVDRRAQGIFNVGSGKAVSTAQVAREVAQVLGVEQKLVVVEPTTETSWLGHSELNIVRACNLLGYQATSLRKGLQRFL